MFFFFFFFNDTATTEIYTLSLHDALPISILGRPLTEQEAGSFLKYMNLLVKWNKTHRLVGSADPEWIIERLLLDSLLFLRILPAGVRWVLDFGTGAGVPGIPIKIVWPEIDMALLES